MQIGSLVPHAPKLARAASGAAPASTSNNSSADSVTLGQRPSWTESAFGHTVTNVARGAAIVGGIPALGALAAQAGGIGITGALAGSVALGAYLGSKSDLGDSTLEKAAMGGSLAGLGCMIGSVAGQVGGVGAGLMVAGTFGAIGAFRGVLETMSEYNWI